MKKKILAFASFFAVLSITAVSFAGYAISGQDLTQPSSAQPGTIDVSSLYVDAPYITVKENPFHTSIHREDSTIRFFEISCDMKLNATSLRQGQTYYPHNAEGTDYFLVFELLFPSAVNTSYLQKAKCLLTSEVGTVNTLIAKTVSYDSTSFSASFPYRDTDFFSLSSFLTFFDAFPASAGQSFDFSFSFSVSDIPVESLSSTGLSNPTIRIGVIHDVGGDGL